MEIVLENALSSKHSKQLFYDNRDETVEVLLGRKSRDKGRGTYKQRDKTDISTKPPKIKKKQKQIN